MEKYSMSNIFSKAFNKLTKEDNFKEKAHILIDVDGVQRNIVSKAINIYNTKYYIQCYQRIINIRRLIITYICPNR